MSILLFLAVLVILILVHEFGHFIVAKKFGIRVDEFGIGFPPKLWGKKYGETEYTFNLIPFGGFVKIFGENPDEESINGPEKERSFINKPFYVQVSVIVAGVFFNLLLAWFLFTVGFMSGLPMPLGSVPSGATIEDARVVITGIEDGTPAEEASFKVGDQILSLSFNGETVGEVTISSLQTFIKSHDGEEITINIKRGKETTLVGVTPQSGIIPEGAAIGIAMDTIGIVKLPIHLAIWESGLLTISLTGSIVVAFVSLIAGAITGTADLSGIAGPIGIVGLVGDAAEFGFIYLLGFVAFISINLAVLNLIPFPALDGGRLFFLIIEVIKGSPMNPRVTNTIHTIGFIVLIGLILLVSYNDIVRIFS